MSFATRTDLQAHQSDAVAKQLPTRAGALFMDMGTGKTRTAQELARIRQGKWDRLFWFCPVSGKATIRHEWLKHTTLTASDIHVFDDKTTAETAPANCKVYIIGAESMGSSDRVVLAYNALVTDRSFVVMDESQYIKGWLAKRTQRITNMSARARYRLVLTGTPFTQGAVDLYAQMNFLSSKILGYRSFWSFAANHLEYEQRKGPDGRKRRTGRIIRTHNEDYLAARVAPYVYQVRKDECLTLPPKLYETRYCEMSSEQSERYWQAKQEILLELEYDDWSPIKIFHLYTTLQAIICGFWNRTDPRTRQKRLIEMDHERVNLLSAVLGEIPDNEPVIIWAKYHHAIRQICERLTSEYGAESIAQYHGYLNEHQREAELQRWRKQGRFLIATQSAGGQVLTLNEAAYSVFYADSFKYAERIQAEDRNYRIGQTRRPVYITLRCSPSIDDKIAAALDRKGNALDAFQYSINEYRREGLKQRAIELVNAL
jgi:hypothetical protein